MDYTDEDLKNYWDGFWNKVIRFYFYLQRGADEINRFRNPILMVYLAPIAFKISNTTIIVWLSVAIFIIMLLAGWFSVHRMGKVLDFLTIRFSTHYAKEQFQIFKDIKELLGGDKALKNKKETDNGS